MRIEMCYDGHQVTFTLRADNEAERIMLGVMAASGGAESHGAVTLHPDPSVHYSRATHEVIRMTMQASRQAPD